MLETGHCISLDCERGLIFDCARPFALRLTKANIALCGFSGTLKDLRCIE
jgi:hypothetical protein